MKKLPLRRRIPRAWRELRGLKNPNTGTMTASAIVTRAATGAVEHHELGKQIVEMTPGVQKLIEKGQG